MCEGEPWDGDDGHQESGSLMQLPPAVNNTRGAITLVLGAITLVLGAAKALSAPISERAMRPAVPVMQLCRGASVQLN